MFINYNRENIIKNISIYFDKTQSELIAHLNLDNSTSTPKNIRNIISKSLFTLIEKENIQKIENIILRTIRIDYKSNPIESISFSQIKYIEIVNEEWHQSYLCKILNSEFLFFIFQTKSKDDNNPKLINAKFWKMNSDDLGYAEKFWELTKDSIQRGDYNNFITEKNDFILHVRPKAKNKNDLMMTPQGYLQPKKAYWLNSSYIKSKIIDQ